MNTDELIEEIKQIITLKKSGIISSESFIYDLVESLYKHSDNDLMKYFLMIDKIDKQKRKERENEMYFAIENGMHLISHIDSELHTYKGTSKNIIKDLEFYWDNLTSITSIAIIYFKNGDCEGASENGKYFFTKFVKYVLKNKETILTGKSKDWAIRMGYYDYFKMIIEKYT